MMKKLFLIGLLGVMMSCMDDETVANHQQSIAITQEAPRTQLPTEEAKIEPTDQQMNAQSADSEEFRVVAYVTTNIVPSTIPYERLTHINYSFLLPNAELEERGILGRKGFPESYRKGALVDFLHEIVNGAE